MHVRDHRADIATRVSALLRPVEVALVAAREALPVAFTDGVALGSGRYPQTLRKGLPTDAFMSSSRAVVRGATTSPCCCRAPSLSPVSGKLHSMPVAKPDWWPHCLILRRDYCCMRWPQQAARRGDAGASGHGQPSAGGRSGSRSGYADHSAPRRDDLGAAPQARLWRRDRPLHSLRAAATRNSNASTHIPHLTGLYLPTPPFCVRFGRLPSGQPRPGGLAVGLADRDCTKCSRPERP